MTCPSRRYTRLVGLLLSFSFTITLFIPATRGRPPYSMYSTTNSHGPLHLLSAYFRRSQLPLTISLRVSINPFSFYNCLRNTNTLTVSLCPLVIIYFQNRFYDIYLIRSIPTYGATPKLRFIYYSLLTSPCLVSSHSIHPPAVFCFFNCLMVSHNTHIYTTCLVSQLSYNVVWSMTQLVFYFPKKYQTYQFPYDILYFIFCY